MNSFVRDHQSLIHFRYSCFDRIICSGYLTQFFAHRLGTAVWFLRTHRGADQLNRAYFGRIANDYHTWVTALAQRDGVPLVQPERDARREGWVKPYFQQLGDRRGLAVILKCREPERLLVHDARTNWCSIERRWVNLYYFYLDDPQAGRMFIRLCPYFPFYVRVWMNGHHWLARRLEHEGIAFDRRDNVFVDCARPARLQELADAFGPDDIRAAVDPWLAKLLPFFTAQERQQGYRHQLYMSQMEYCDNLIFHKQAAAARLFDRLLDGARGLGHPDKLAIIFGRPLFRADTRTGQTSVRITKLRTPVVSSSYKQTSVKQYVSHGVGLRTESSTYALKDLSVKKSVDNLPVLRQVLGTANERYLDSQQAVLGSYVDRGQLQALRRPSISATGRRLPGLHLDDPRLLAVLQAVTCFAYLVGKGCFRTADLLPDVRKALDDPEYKLAQLRYDLSKLRGKGWVSRLPGSQSYQLTREGYRLAVLYLKLYQRLYAPLTAGVRDPVPDDNRVFSHRQSKLDRLYTAVDQALDRLTKHVGIGA